MTSGSHIKLDLVELIQVVDYVRTISGIQQRTSCIIPVTEGKDHEAKVRVKHNKTTRNNNTKQYVYNDFRSVGKY